jgi:hypothetical protein
VARIYPLKTVSEVTDRLLSIGGHIGVGRVKGSDGLDGLDRRGRTERGRNSGHGGEASKDS